MTRGPGVLVAGLGHPDRGDDAAGLLVADRVRRLHLPGVDVVTAPTPLDLLDAWRGYRQVVVVDAVRRGDEHRHAGRPCVLDLADSAPVGHLAGDTPYGSRAGRGTHDFELGDVVRLARSLGRLPELLWLVGVPATGLETGAALTPGTVRAIAPAVQAVVALLPVRRAPRRRRPCSRAAPRG